MKLTFKLAVKNAWLVPPTYFWEAAVTDEVSEVGTDTTLPFWDLIRPNFRTHSFWKVARAKREKKLYILFPLSSLLGYRHISLCRKLENAISAEQRLCSQQHVVVTWTCGRLKFSFACKAKEAISHRRRWAGETLAKTSGRSRKAQTQSKVSGCKKKKKISRLGAPHISM